MNSTTTDSTTPAPAPQAPDFDPHKVACHTLDEWQFHGEFGDLESLFVHDLRNAYAAGRRAQIAADVAEIRRIAATTNPEPLAAAALTAMADRLAMIGGH